MFNSKKLLASFLALFIILAGCSANKDTGEKKETEKIRRKLRQKER